jgi:uncharacterized protein YodC (DUF2158 family)
VVCREKTLRVEARACRVRGEIDCEARQQRLEERLLARAQGKGLVAAQQALKPAPSRARLIRLAGHFHGPGHSKRRPPKAIPGWLCGNVLAPQRLAHLEKKSSAYPLTRRRLGREPKWSFAMSETVAGNPFEVGAVVRLKSGGPPMPVCWHKVEEDRVYLCWFFRGRAEEATYRAEMLERCEPSELVSLGLPEKRGRLASPGKE